MATRSADARSGSPPGLEAATLCEAFQLSAGERAGEVALRTLGDKVSITWREYAERVRDLAAGLAGLGVGAGDTVALMLTNRPEFNVVDVAAMHLGAIAFSVYNTSSPEQIEYLLGDSESRVVITEAVFVGRVEAARPHCPALEHVLVVEALDELAARGDPGFDFDAAWQAVTPDDLVTLIYTSGTTGPPKGVQLTHANVLAQWRAIHEVMPRPAGGRVVSYLPAAHVADRVVTHYGALVYGTQLTLCPNPQEVIAHLPDVRPTLWGAVPRIWEKLKAALDASMDEPTRAAVEVGLRVVRAQQAGEEVPAQLRDEWAQADELVLGKLRERLGLDAAEDHIVGAAPTPPEVLEFFQALGMNVCELWGMSETCGVATLNPADQVRIGTVGPPLPAVELRLADDGEVLVRGEMCTSGYRNLPDKTAELLDADGWLHTGDIGELDSDGYLRIVDRKKELIINAAGKNMSPANIESALKSAGPLVGQACVIGDRRPYNVALLVLDPDALPAFAAAHDLDAEALGSLGTTEAVIAAVAEGVRHANERLSRVEQIKRFKILDEEWLPGGDELTPTMKLKRKPIAEKYRDEIEALYFD
jgi:long-subunit acyl-CoA synthetase (AMP-forming)